MCILSMEIILGLEGTENATSWIDFKCKMNGMRKVFGKQKCDRNLSDHKIISLSNNKVNWDPKPFKVFNWWLEDESLLKLIWKSWEQNTNIHDCNIQMRLKKIKKILNEWSATIIRESELRIKFFQQRFDKFDQDNEWGKEI